MIVLIDNYDSFTWNLVHALWAAGQQVRVVTNDQMSVEALLALSPRGLVVSPGPCSPSEAGVSMAAIRAFSERMPVLGVCLGHQALAAAFGGEVVRAPVPVHGKTSRIHHNGEGIFAGVPNDFEAMRYHSLVVEKKSLPKNFHVTASTDDLIMGLTLAERPVFGVQFHPESIFTPSGAKIVENFVRLCA